MRGDQDGARLSDEKSAQLCCWRAAYLSLSEVALLSRNRGRVVDAWVLPGARRNFDDASLRILGIIVHTAPRPKLRGLDSMSLS